MMYHSSRVLRTPSSERHILKRDGHEVGAIDLHYLGDGRVAATIIILEDSKITDPEVPEILKYIDDDLLPEVSVEANNLVFTVVRGRILGNFTREQTPDDA